MLIGEVENWGWQTGENKTMMKLERRTFTGMTKIHCDKFGSVTDMILNTVVLDHLKT